MSKNKSQFVFSIVTACVTGIVLSLGGILAYKYIPSIVRAVSKDDMVAKVPTREEMEKIKNKVEPQNEEEDPTTVSGFSRVFIYSAEKEELRGQNEFYPRYDTTGKIGAKAYAVFDLDRDITVLEKNTLQALPIASITKLVTAVISLKNLNKYKTIEITNKMIRTEGGTGNLKIGERYTVNELLYPLLMVSSNDAAEALAQSYDRKEFIKEMNNFVSSIGAYRTYFADPSGLSAKNISTAKDLQIITKWILKNYPEIFDLTLTKSKNLRLHTWTNPTHFLNIDAYVGGKNGYTEEANRTTLSLFKLGKDKRLYLAVLLGSEERDSDTLLVLGEALR